MRTWDDRIDRMLGYIGLFIIGALGWTADRLAELRAPRPAAPRPAPCASRSAE